MSELRGGRRTTQNAARSGAAEPLLEGLQKPKGNVSVDILFSLVNELGMERKKHAEALAKAEAAIKEAYNRFTPEQRVEFFARLYDQFAETYDKHMGEETGHFWAMKRVVHYAAPYLKFPMIDITSGTGELLKYVLDLIEASARLKQLAGGSELDILFPHLPKRSEGSLVVANEISEKMLQKAREKLKDRDKIRFTTHNAHQLPAHLRSRFNTVLCSQTFHLISDEDKVRLVRSIHNALIPGGIAVVLEEDPFRISPTAPIAPVSLFIRSIASPIKHPSDLIGVFRTNGLSKLEIGAVESIDEHHNMKLHLFQK